MCSVFDPVNYSCGVTVPVEYVQPRSTVKDTKPLRKQRSNLTTPQNAKVYTPEKLHMLFKITRTGEEKVSYGALYCTYYHDIY